MALNCAAMTTVTTTQYTSLSKNRTISNIKQAHTIDDNFIANLFTNINNIVVNFVIDILCNNPNNDKKWKCGMTIITSSGLRDVR